MGKDKRDHIYRGMDIVEYHVYLDTPYNFMMEQEFLCNSSEFTNLFELDRNKQDDHDEAAYGEEDTYHQSDADKSSTHCKMKMYPWTISPESNYYQPFKFLKVLSMTYLCFFYPFLSY